jgi:hypothetical protein
VNPTTGVVNYQAFTNTRTTGLTATLTVSASGAIPAVFTVTEPGSTDILTNRQVRALYQRLLGREPDVSGWAFWTGVGEAGLGQMADDFLTSAEGQIYNFQVVLIYKGLLNRFPTYDEASAGLATIRPPAPSSQAAILFTDVLVSPEYLADYGPFNNTNFVTNLYQNLLGRAPTSSELNADVSNLANGALTAYGIFSLLTAGQEFQNTGPYVTATDHSNAAYIDLLYLLILGRVPDPSGFAFWLGVANGGGSGIYYNGSAAYPTRIQILGTGVINEGFTGSAEFQCPFQ